MLDRVPYRYHFYRELSRLLPTGQSLPDILEALAAETPHDRQPPLHKLTSEVRKGMTLTAAMKTVPGCFPADEQALLAFGEAHGRLVEALAEAARSLDVQGRIWCRYRNLFTALLIPTALVIAYLTLLLGKTVPLLGDLSFGWNWRQPSLLVRSSHSLAAFLNQFSIPALIAAGSLLLLALVLQCKPSWPASPGLRLIARLPGAQHFLVENDFARLCLLLQFDLLDKPDSRIRLDYDLAFFCTPQMRRRLSAWRGQLSDTVSLQHVLRESAPEHGPAHLLRMAFSMGKHADLPNSLSSLNRVFDQRARPGNLRRAVPLLGAFIYLFLFLAGYLSLRIIASLF